MLFMVEKKNHDTGSLEKCHNYHFTLQVKTSHKMPKIVREICVQVS